MSAGFADIFYAWVIFSLLWNYINFYTAFIMSDLFNKLLIIRTPGVGPAKYADLLRRFGGADAAAASIGADVHRRDAILREMDAASRMGIHYICDDDDLYPAALRAVKNHPPVITVRGNLDTLRRPVVSMVGTRHATAAGMGFMANMARDFAQNGYAVASGLAMGTDTAAHRGALRSNSCTATIAVLAGGVDYIWPLENESLYYDIVSNGAVISEMPVGFVPSATNFVQRNRWIAGIAQKLILGEADKKSGSMTTARFAIEYGRDIWAIPSHPADPRSVGPNSLISGGLAKLCVGSVDFFENVDKNAAMGKNSEKVMPENPLLDKLGINPVSESVLAQIVKKPISEIKSDLVILELQGLVRKVDGGYIRI